MTDPCPYRDRRLIEETDYSQGGEIKSIRNESKILREYSLVGQRRLQG